MTGLKGDGYNPGGKIQSLFGFSLNRGLIITSQAYKLLSFASITFMHLHVFIKRNFAQKYAVSSYWFSIALNLGNYMSKKEITCMVDSHINLF